MIIILVSAKYWLLGKIALLITGMAATTSGLTPELLASIVVIFLSLLFAYLPGLKKWYGGLLGEYQATIMGIMLILTTAVIFGLACVGLAGDMGLAVICDRPGAIVLIKILISALIANQATYMLLVKPFKKS